MVKYVYGLEVLGDFFFLVKLIICSRELCYIFSGVIFFIVLYLYFNIVMDCCVILLVVILVKDYEYFVRMFYI